MKKDLKSNQEKRWIIYKHTNKVNGKVYIGITCKKKAEWRWCNGKHYESNKHFNNAIKKYGWDNFEHEILFDDIISEEEAVKIEYDLIKQYNSLDSRYGYNKLEGGSGYRSGYKMSEQHRLSMIKSLKENWAAFKESPEYEEYRKTWLEQFNLYRASLTEEQIKEIANKSRETRKKNDLERYENKPFCLIDFNKKTKQYYIKEIYPNAKSSDFDWVKVRRSCNRYSKFIKNQKEIDLDLFQKKEGKWIWVEDACILFVNFSPIVKVDINSGKIIKIKKNLISIQKDRRNKVEDNLNNGEIINNKYRWLYWKDFVNTRKL